MGFKLSINVVGPLQAGNRPADHLCLQAQGMGDKFSIEELAIEAGHLNFEGAVKDVGEVLEYVAKESARRDPRPYASKGE